jgi:A-factor type gamma-butyrolactone 1'-reductase (1S-forming)
MGLLDGKIALVTGGGSGIGRSAAILFSKEGAKVAIAGRRQYEGEQTVDIIKKEGGTAFFMQVDVSVNNDVKKFIGKIISLYGRLDCAFNNAGIDGKKASLIELEEIEWDEIIDINLKGTFLLMKYEIICMLEQRGGAIVNMASVCSFIARPDRCAYNASRHGVVGLTRSSALEVAHKGIRVNAVAPGSTRTDIFLRSTKGNTNLEKFYAESHPMKRIAEPKEIAEAALWLCSDRSSFVVGHTLIVDGGFTIQ